MRPFARTFEDLEVWRVAHGFALEVYKLTAAFPKTETYGLASQTRRAAVSIPANIAEGFRKRGRADKARFLNIAQGSLEECRYYLILTRDLGYGDPATAMERIVSTGRLLDAYLKGVLNNAAGVLSSPPDSRLLTPDSRVT
jgi:four helix bundle protein